jgi:hypothetical protein
MMVEKVAKSNTNNELLAITMLENIEKQQSSGDHSSLPALCTGD